MSDTQTDIIELQMRLSFQDGVIDELNQVVTDQQQQLDRLQRQIDKLMLQIANLHQTSSIAAADEPPPHY